LPFVLKLLPETGNILVALILWPLLGQLVPVLNHYRAYTIARLLYSLSTILVIVFIALQLGPETANHFFLIASIIGFFIIFPPSQLSILILMVFIAGLSFASLEWYFRFNSAILVLPEDYILIARWSSISALVTIIIAITAYHYRVVTESEQKLNMEHQRSESLLLNILPESIAVRLKKQEKPIADQINEASILFVDLVGFTMLSGQIHHQRLVEILNELFSEFDRIVTLHKVEKIKMIGDAYMVAGGVPISADHHHLAIAQCALEMLAYIRSKPIEDAPELGIRIGIHCGPVVAGVICEKKFAYDLWGDTVNIASRMESHGIPNQIQVSEDFHNKTCHQFVFTPRGFQNIKGKGNMLTFLLEGKIRT